MSNTKQAIIGFFIGVIFASCAYSLLWDIAYKEDVPKMTPQPVVIEKTVYRPAPLSQAELTALRKIARDVINHR
jgi:hypothetical protein